MRDLQKKARYNLFDRFTKVIMKGEDFRHINFSEKSYIEPVVGSQMKYLGEELDTAYKLLVDAKALVECYLCDVKMANVLEKDIMVYSGLDRQFTDALAEDISLNDYTVADFFQSVDNIINLAYYTITNVLNAAKIKHALHMFTNYEEYVGDIPEERYMVETGVVFSLTFLRTKEDGTRQLYSYGSFYSF